VSKPKRKKAGPHTWAIPFTITVTGHVYITGSRKAAEAKAREMDEHGFDLRAEGQNVEIDEWTEVHQDRIEDMGEY